MAIDQDFFIDCLPEPYTILGVRLRPFSLGHLIILTRLESPFITGEKLPSIDDLVTGVLVCSMRYEQAIAALQDPAIGRKIRKWYRAVKWANRLRSWLRFKREHRIDWPAKIILFADYIQQHTREINIAYNPSNGRELRCPAAEMIKVGLLRETNLTEHEILDAPYRVRLRDWLTVLAMRPGSDVSFVDGELSNAIDEARKVAEQLAERLNKKDQPHG